MTTNGTNAQWRLRVCKLAAARHYNKAVTMRDVVRWMEVRQRLHRVVAQGDGLVVMERVVAC